VLREQYYPIFEKLFKIVYNFYTISVDFLKSLDLLLNKIKAWQLL
jgi:hypothetical protein